MRSRAMKLSGWGNVIRHDGHVYRPEKLADVGKIVSRTETGAPFIARGLGRSYGDSAINQDGNVVLDTRLDRLASFDSTTGVVECEAGLSISDLIDVFLPRAFFPPVTPGTRFVTLGGAIAA